MKSVPVRLLLAAALFAAPALTPALAQSSPAKPAAMSTMKVKKVNINTATLAQLQTIPGVGPKIAAEIVDYRPYNNLAKFRKEIGKYVKSAQLEKMVPYITLK
ncbi:competence protein ComEA [Deinococcus aerius]|uniref:Competence protein ComEA n=3 Tax=Deinococcus TaxID=1298 RepID=A0A2I9DEU9_9DEIO|nr:MULTISPECIES: helix-hairpin-helix domain-containing protein [Deinococcus]ABW35051.1 Competence protein ComEA related helix-hairpin-helix domain [Deinococcus geothermalis DSM 11300]MBB5293602.1 competence protein ComEA [Deinococcus metallilatus]QBY07414.1 helix-hairpin-helix domain-containing protein [Deinococcus metallilatus]RXJ14887.1 helix-hairpin-helix domain-containing protein [Deinococcus metallilatus]TLK31008.1 helix-hairpin-helix domain-containing protein [Deinococcus metallilatus]